MFLGICSKANKVKVSLHKVEDHLLESHLPVLWGHIILPLGLYYALSKVLKTGTLWSWTTNVNNSVNLYVNLQVEF